MNIKHLISFALGLILGAALLFGFEHSAKIVRLFHAPESMQARVSGQWQGKVDLAGTAVGFSMLIKNNGNALTGVLHAPQVGDLPCDHIAIDPAGNISFSVHVDDKGANFSGKLTPDTHSMAGNLTSSIGSGDWTLTKKQS
jgi:hypothetical protein